MATETDPPPLQSASLVALAGAGRILRSDLCKALTQLMFNDPAADSAEGVILDALATAIDRYERIVFPFREPTPEELEAFRREEGTPT